MIFNTPGHAADWRSIGSNARITRGMKAGKRWSTALPAHSTAPRCRRERGSRRRVRLVLRTSRRATWRGAARRFGLSRVREHAGHQAAAVPETRARSAMPSPRTAIASACWPRIAHTRPSPAIRARSGIELHGPAGARSASSISPDHSRIFARMMPHLAQRILVDHARQLEPGLVGASESQKSKNVAYH